MTHGAAAEAHAGRRLDRRAFLGVCACGLLGLGLPGCASLAARRVASVGGLVELPLLQHPELTEPGGALRIQVDDGTHPIYVLALGDGTFAAVSPICTHLGCTVDIQGAHLVCPCHGSTYDRTGRVLRGPAELPLARHPVSASADGVLTIDLRGGR